MNEVATWTDDIVLALLSSGSKQKNATRYNLEKPAIGTILGDKSTCQVKGRKTETLPLVQS